MTRESAGKLKAAVKQLEAKLRSLKFSKEKIEEHSNKHLEDLSIKVVTTDFHALRSNLLAKKNGYENVNFYTNNTVSYLIPVFYSREALALVKSFLFD